MSEKTESQNENHDLEAYVKKVLRDSFNAVIDDTNSIGEERMIAVSKMIGCFTHVANGDLRTIGLLASVGWATVSHSLIRHAKKEQTEK